MKSLICNQCGRELKTENEIIKEDFIHVNKAWGYFSEKDGVTCDFYLCEECAALMMKNFAIPVDEYETVEMV